MLAACYMPATEPTAAAQLRNQARSSAAPRGRVNYEGQDASAASVPPPAARPATSGFAAGRVIKNALASPAPVCIGRLPWWARGVRRVQQRHGRQTPALSSWILSAKA
jgi:hypothetical protein